MVRLCGLRCMSFRPFTSESYAEPDRPEAWRDPAAGAWRAAPMTADLLRRYWPGGQTNLLIYKPAIKYMYKEGENSKK